MYIRQAVVQVGNYLQTEQGALHSTNQELPNAVGLVQASAKKPLPGVQQQVVKSDGMNMDKVPDAGTIVDSEVTATIQAYVESWGGTGLSTAPPCQTSAQEVSTPRYGTLDT